MNPSPDLNPHNLSHPEKHWLERFFQSGKLADALSNHEGPRIFYEWSEGQNFAPLETLDHYHLYYVEGSSPPSELCSQAQTQRVVSSNPDEWQIIQSLTSVDNVVFYFENPCIKNGFATPQTLFKKLLNQFSVAKEKVLITNDTLGCFGWDQAEEIARSHAIINIKNNDWQTYLYWDISLLAPQAKNSRLCWSEKTHTSKFNKEPIASPLHWKLLERELARYPETTRRKHLALRNLKTSGEKLRALIQNEELLVHYWPLAGAWLEIELSPKSPLYRSREWLEKRLKHEGLSIQTKDFPRLQISYLRETSDYEAALDILTKCLISGTDSR